jgi:nucleoside-diphosphate-sugar epimerase
MAEMLCSCYFHQYKIPTYCVRLEHTYGPTIDLNTDKRVFAEFVSNIVNNHDIIIKSDGLTSRNFCYISDTIESLFRVLLNGEPGESYNVGNNEGKITIKDLAQMLVDLFPEKHLKIIYEKRYDDYLENKIKNSPILSTLKLELLGYKAKINLKDGFLRTINSFTCEKEI